MQATQIFNKLPALRNWISAETVHCVLRGSDPKNGANLTVSDIRNRAGTGANVSFRGPRLPTHARTVTKPEYIPTGTRCSYCRNGER